MGSSLNKHRTAENLELSVLDRKPRSKSITENQDDFEECILVWLDSTINYSDAWTEELNQAREIINNLKIFDNLNECINFMKMVVHDKIFLIVSNQFIHSVCSIKAELRSLWSIYVYCDQSLTSIKRQELTSWAKTNEPLITGVYLNSVDCFAQLTSDVNDICDHDSIPVTLLSSETKNLNLKQSSPFLIFHLLFQNVLSPLSMSKPPITQQQRQRIFRSCAYYYRDNEKRLEEIRHVEEHYNSSSAIDWYLRTRFLSRLLNKASRTQNMSLLFDYSFIFFDIHNLMQENASNSINANPKEIFYRAQNLTADDLYRLRANLNGIISINRYLDLCKTAEEAVSEISIRRNALETVLYHFSLSHSYIPISENRVLLSIGSVFRIKHVGMEIDGLWHVHLTSMSQSEVDAQTSTLLNGLDYIPHSYVSIGLIYDKIKQSVKADRYYRLLIDHLPKQSIEKAVVCNYVGNIFRLKCHYVHALNYHQQALALYKEKNHMNPSYNEDIARTYAQIALVYKETGEALKAIEHFTLALKNGADAYSDIAEIYRNTEQFDVAHRYYEKANVESDTGLCYIYQRMFTQALNHLKKETDPMPYVNLGAYHQLRKEYGTALVFFERALEVAKNHPLDTAMIHSYLGLLNCDRRQWLLSMRHYEQALNLYRQHLSTNNHPTVALIHDGLGSLYLSKGEYRAAQHEFERCLELQLRVLPPTHPDIAGTYNNLGGVLNEMGRYEDALLYHYEALAIATETLPNDHFDIKLYKHNVIETKRKLSYN